MQSSCHIDIEMLKTKVEQVIGLANKGGIMILCYTDSVNYSNNHCVRIAMSTKRPRIPIRVVFEGRMTFSYYVNSVSYSDKRECREDPLFRS